MQNMINKKIESKKFPQTCGALKQDTVVLMSTLDWKVEGSNPSTANFSFEEDDLDVRRKKEDGNENRRARKRPLTCKRARIRT